MHILMQKVHIFVKIVKVREKIWVFEFPEPTLPLSGPQESKWIERADKASFGAI